MKILLTIINDLKTFITSERRIFLIFACSLTVAAISFLILFSFCLSSRNSFYEEFGYKTRTYGINFNNIDKTKKDYILKSIQKFSELPNIDEINVASKVKLSNGESIVIVGYEAKRDLFYCTEGKKFTNEELESGNNIVIPWSGYFDYSKKTSYLNTDFLINNTKFKVLGIADYDCENKAFIPLKTYLNNNFDTSFLSIVFSKRLNSTQELKLTTFLQKIDSTIGIIIPPKVDKSQETQFIERLVIYICLLIFTLINVISMFTFWIYKNAGKFKIFRLCGANNFMVYIIVLAEAFILCTFIMIISYILYLLIVPLLIEFHSYYRLSNFNILIAYLVMILSTLAIVHKTAIKIVNTSQIYNYK